jgi:hypothetical protein
LVYTPAFAQKVGDNIAVLPVVEQQGIDDDEWWKFGDGFLQRQVEATIGASTLNPDHLIAFFNDYRAVDTVEGDVGLGETEAASMALAAAKTLMALVGGPMLPTVDLPVSMFASAEAWIGGGLSKDGGFTWSGFFLPGAPFDTSEFSKSMPISGLEAATDPVLACGPCGYFYVVFVAFTRGQESNMVVARYRDTNDLEGGHSIRFEGMKILETGNNAEHGFFLDKPDIEVDLVRYGATAKAKPGSNEPVDQCAHRVYASYTTFNGLTKDDKIQTKVNFAMSEDLGDNWYISKIQQPFNQNQGSAIAVDPRPGTPTTTGGGTVYLFWRHFFDPDAIVWTKSTDYGNRWARVKSLTDAPALVPFDQPTISTTALIQQGYATATTENPETAFRSNGFPTAVVAPHFNVDAGRWDSTIFVAWQERVDIIHGVGHEDSFGKPLEAQVDPDALLLNGSPRIVMMRSKDEGLTWTGFDEYGVGTDTRMAVDLADRTEPFDPYMLEPAAEAKAATSLRPAGPQVQPKLASGGGRVMATFYESRGRIGTDEDDDEVINSDPYDVDNNPIFPYISGYDRVLDFRATLLDPVGGEKISSAQISRYPISAGADLSDGQDLSDVAPINAPCSPDYGDYPDLDACIRQVSRSNYTTSALGTSPFMGDYPDVVPFVQFVQNPDGSWRWAIKPEDVPARGFHTVWSDNRHIVPPTEIDPNSSVPPLSAEPQEWELFQYYGPPGIEGACYNAGSRNTDVLTARVETDVVISTPTTYKQLDAPRSFPFSVNNKTGEFRTYRFTIASGEEPYVSFSPKPGADALTTYEVVIFPFSAASLAVYVTPPEGVEDPTGAVGPIRVDVELLCSNSLPDDCVPCAGEECESGSVVFNANPDNLPVQNLGPQEAEFFGPQIGDAFVINWNFGDAFVINDFVENGFLDNAFVINEGEENAFVINQGDPNAFVINSGAENAFVINAFVINAFVINAFVINSTLDDPDPVVVYGVTDTVWTMDPGTSNTASSFLPLVNIDNAHLMQGKYAFQLIVDKPSSYAGVGRAPDDACVSYNVSRQQVLSNVVQDPNEANAFVINDSPENAFVINNSVANAFVINSTFAVSPSDTSSGFSSATAKNLELNDGPTKAAPPSNKVRITLRAFQLVPDGELTPDPITGKRVKFNPVLHPPTIAVFDLACDPQDPESECAAINGADLIIDESIDTTPLTVDPCGTVPFPAFTMVNNGNADAVARNGLSDEIAPMRHAVFLSTDEILDFSGDPLNGDALLTEFFSTRNPLAGVNDDPDADPVLFTEELFDSVEVTMPPNVTGGEYFLILYVDYPREASEYDETNNTVAIPLTVKPSFVFESLQSPLVYDSIHYANAGSAVPLKWRYVDGEGNPVDSQEPRPFISIEGWSGQLCGQHGVGDPDTVLEDPGSSGQRYDSFTMEWQFNWQTKEDGDPLPEGCYEITISSSLTCESQGDGPFLVYLD